MTRLTVLCLVLAQADGVTLKYGVEKSAKDRIYSEWRLAIKIEGPDPLAGMVRSMSPLLSLNNLVVRAEGSKQIVSKGKQKYDIEMARVEVRYDDENHEYDFEKGVPPADLAKDKLKQMMWILAVSGRNFSLSADGEYRSDDPNQDHNGEAMDLMALGITRMPDRAVKAGDSYEREWKGSRKDKNKKKGGVFAFKQKVQVEKIEERQGKKIATLTSLLTGEVVDGEKDPSADEAWTKCQGKTKAVIEVDGGRVLSSEGSGQVTVYHRGTAENGSKQELTLTFTSEGRMTTQ
jgi:hypothetical protein